MLKLALFVIVALVFPAMSHAGTVTLLPPGTPLTGGSTVPLLDGWQLGRGVELQATADMWVDSVGVFLALTNITVSYEVSQIQSLATPWIGRTVLSSGSRVVTTSGFQFVDFSFQPLEFNAGNDYHINFTLSGIADGRFYYFNNNVPLTVGEFAQIDGTNSFNPSNTVMPAIRVDVVPEPNMVMAVASAFALFGVGWLKKR